jgi:uncharacterized membrane protein
MGKLGIQSSARCRFPGAAAVVTVFMSYVLSFVYIGIYWNKLRYGNHPSEMMLSKDGGQCRA